MPIYEYKCRVCGGHFDVEQSFTDETLTEIDGCEVDESGRHQVRKVFAAPAIAFKGDGFYRNDARSSGGASSTSSTDSSSSDKTSSDKTSSTSSGSSDTSSSKSDSSAGTSSSSSSGDKATTSSSSSSSSTTD